MTVTAESRERQRRIAAAWAADPDADVDEIAAAVDRDMADEAEARAEGDAWIEGIIDSGVRLMFTCHACGGSSITSPCERCRAVDYFLMAQEAADEVVRGHTRREWVMAYRERQQKKGALT